MLKFLKSGFAAWFRDNINYCEPLDSWGRVKAEYRGYWGDRFWDVYWLLFQYPKPYESPCWCCAALRGIIVGGVAGLAIGFALGKIL